MNLQPVAASFRCLAVRQQCTISSVRVTDLQQVEERFMPWDSGSDAFGLHLL